MKLKNVRFIQEAHLIQIQGQRTEIYHVLLALFRLLILNKLELVRQNLGEEAKLKVCRLSVHVRF